MEKIEVKNPEHLARLYKKDPEMHKKHIDSVIEKDRLPTDEELDEIRRLIREGDPNDYENVYSPLSDALSNLHHIKKLGIAEQEWIEVLDDIADKLMPVAF